jgi:hypothetical protein
MLISLLKATSRCAAALNPAGCLHFQRASSTEEIQKLQQEFWKRDGVLFPEEYLNAGCCYLAHNKSGELIGGFAVIRNAVPRTLLQLPESAHMAFLNSLKPGERIVETTGVWLKKQRFHLTVAMLFWSKLFSEVYRQRKTVNVFSCDSRKARLLRMYETSAGGIVYNGIITPLSGMENNGAAEEVVFYARKNDFARGFFKEFKRRASKLWL